MPLPKVDATYDIWARYVASLHGRWTAYSVKILGVAEGEIHKRVETAECLDREREAGRIR